MSKNFRSTFWVKSTATLLICLLMAETVTWAAPAPIADVLRETHRASRSEVRIEALVDKIQIPASLGAIQETLSGNPVPGEGVSLIHIEDAHGEPEAQKNTQAILELLEKEYGVRTFFLEGAWSKLEPQLLSFTPDKEANQKILEDLTEKGILGGPENFLYKNFAPRATSHESRKTKEQNVERGAWSVERVQGFGIEDLELYKKNLEQFRTVIAAKAESDVFLAEMKSALLTKASQVLNPELAAYFRQWSFQEEIQTDYARHIESLASNARKHLNLDLDDAREQYDWPQLVRFFKLRELEKNKEQGTKDKEKFPGWLSNQKLDHYTGCFDSESLFLVPCSLFHGDARQFFEKFYEKAAPKGFKFKNYPELSKVWGKQILAQEIDASQLLIEMQKLEKKLLEKLAATPDEKKLIAKYREYLLLRKLLRLELTKEEWQQLEPRTTNHEPRTTNHEGTPVLTWPVVRGPWS